MSGKKVFQILLNLIITLLIGFIWFYFMLPAINLQDESFYTFIGGLFVIYWGIHLLTSGLWRRLAGFRHESKHLLIPIVAIGGLFFVIELLGGFFSSPLFNADAYHNLMTVEEGNFVEDVEEISYEQIPMLDRASAEKLGDRKLGELADMVSQFEVSSEYDQINYQGRPVRVTTLLYGDIIKWFNNTGKGYPAYIMIDMVTQDVNVVRLEDGMKYSTDEHFFRNVQRHLRFQYPTMMFDTPSFEVKDDGTPYWICPRIVKTIGLFGGVDVQGAVLMNAITGESAYYEEVPSWVDRIYSAELLIEQYDYYGQYGDGFWNSIFGQKGVTVTTDGYNYIALDDDIYIYTGITSVGGDESNVGFILSNQRTKETRYYAIAGAEEYSAMSSAEGIVQHLNYEATFPLLLNIHGQPTYFMALKDYAGLVKMYAMVNVQQYQVVATGTTLTECEENYQKLLQQQGTVLETQEGNEVTGRIEELRSAVLEGTTWYYMRLSGESVFYGISLADAPEAVLLTVGDMVKIEYVLQDESSLLTALSVEKQ